MKLIIIATFIMASVVTNAQNQILGTWKTESGKATVEIFKSGNYYYGKIIALKTPLTDAGKPKVDNKNPNKADQAKPLIGLLFLKGFEWDASDTEWDNGKIYDPESGKTYESKMWLKDNNTLKLRGYVGIFYKTQEWTRVK
jgi:uncharacterized protein (DUF2147 family)